MAVSWVVLFETVPPWCHLYALHPFFYLLLPHHLRSHFHQFPHPPNSSLNVCEIFRSAPEATTNCPSISSLHHRDPKRTLDRFLPNWSLSWSNGIFSFPSLGAGLSAFLRQVVFGVFFLKWCDLEVKSLLFQFGPACLRLSFLFLSQVLLSAAFFHFSQVPLTFFFILFPFAFLLPPPQTPSSLSFATICSPTISAVLIASLKSSSLLVIYHCCIRHSSHSSARPISSSSC